MSALPTFVSPDEVPRLPEMPSPERRRNVRIICVVVALVWFLAFWIGFTQEVDELIIAAVLPLLLASVSRWVSTVRRDLGWWVVKSAWLGERAKPPRRLVASVERYERWQREQAEKLRVERAQAQASHRDGAERARRRVAVQNWVEEGLIPAAAPRGELVVPESAARQEARLTVGEADAVFGAVGAAGAGFWAELFPADPNGDLTRFIAAREVHRTSISRRLADRGTLRAGPDGPEIAPDWLPLLGVALFARRSVTISWDSYGRMELVRALMVPGHTVEQRCTADAEGGADDVQQRLSEALLKDPDLHEHRLRRTTPEAIVNAALAGLESLDIPLPSGAPSWMHVAVHQGEDWVIKRDGAGYSLARLGADVEPDRRALPVSEVRDWMLQVMSV